MDNKKRVYYRTELKDRRRDLRRRSTPAEKLLWEQLRNNKLGFKFRRQYSVQGYVVDFFCSEKRLAVELLGGIHKKTKRYDDYRKKYLEAFWIKILEFRNEEVEANMRKVLSEIKHHLTLH